MKVTLKAATKLSIAVMAVRTCWDSHDKGGCYIEPTDNIIQKDRELLDRVINKNMHGSVAEHLTYNFHISGISRALLQELARHRIASLSVKSTRYTLKELKDEETFKIEDKSRANKYLVFTGVDFVDEMSIKALENLRLVLKESISNDIAKYCLPESYKTDLHWTINARSLQNFLNLRSDKSALWEIRTLAKEIFNSLPQSHKYLFYLKNIVES